MHPVERLRERQAWAGKFAEDLKTIFPAVKIEGINWVSGQVIIDIPEDAADEVSRQCQCHLTVFKNSRVGVKPL